MEWSQKLFVTELLFHFYVSSRENEVNCESHVNDKLRSFDRTVTYFFWVEMACLSSFSTIWPINCDVPLHLDRNHLCLLS